MPALIFTIVRSIFINVVTKKIVKAIKPKDKK